jgi:hypothetical protein
MQELVLSPAEGINDNGGAHIVCSFDSGQDRFHHPSFSSPGGNDYLGCRK